MVYNREEKIGNRKKTSCCAIGAAILLLLLLCATVVGCTPKIQTYTLYIDANGGSFGSGITQQSVVYEVGDPIGSIDVANPTRAGYTFVGYSLSKTEMQAVNLQTERTDTLTVYAHWNIKSFTVTFEGTAIDIDPTVVTYNSLCTEPSTPVREGYTFNGWRKTSETGTKFNFDREAIIADITLYASWSVTMYDVTFNANGGTGVTTAHIRHGQTVTKQLTTRTGYTFVNWFYYFDPYDFTQPVTSNLTLTARWEANAYSLKYDFNGGEFNSSKDGVTVDCTYDQPFTLLDAPTRAGHTFSGYLINGTVYSPLAAVSNLTSDANGEVKVTAQWTAIDYTLTVASQSGAGVYADTNNSPLRSTYRYGATVTVVVKFNQGYTQAFFKDDLVLTLGYGDTSREINSDSRNIAGKYYTYSFLMPEHNATLSLSDIRRNVYSVNYKFSGGKATLNGSDVPNDVSGVRSHGEPLSNYIVSKIGNTFTGWNVYYNDNSAPSDRKTTLDGDIAPNDTLTSITYEITAITYTAQFVADTYNQPSDSAVSASREANDATFSVGVGHSANQLRLDFSTLIQYGNAVSFTLRANTWGGLIIAGVNNANARVIYEPATASGGFNPNDRRTVECIARSDGDYRMFTTVDVLYGRIVGIQISGVEYATFTVTARGLNPENSSQSEEYAIKYDQLLTLANGGTNVFANPPTATGYNFSHWTDSYGTRVNDISIEKVRGNTFYTAVFTPIQFTVKYVLGGGTYPDSTIRDANGIEWGTMTRPFPTNGEFKFSYLMNVPLWNSSRDGYIFDGWNMTKGNEEDPVKKYDAGTTQTESRLTDSSSTVITLTAIWKEIKYKVEYYAGTAAELNTNSPAHVTYVNNSGEVIGDLFVDTAFRTSDPESPSGIDYTAEYSLFANNIVDNHLVYRSGDDKAEYITYELAGWRLENSDVVMSPGSKVSKLASQDGAIVKLYAVWQRIYSSVTVKYTTYGARSSTNLSGIIEQEFTYNVEQFGKVVFDDSTTTESYEGYVYAGVDRASRVIVYKTLNLKDVIGREVSVRGNHLDDVSFVGTSLSSVISKHFVYENGAAVSITDSECVVADGTVTFKRYAEAVDFSVEYLENTYTVNYYDGSIEKNDNYNTTGGIYIDDNGKKLTYTARFFDDGAGSNVNFLYDGSGSDGKEVIVCKYPTKNFLAISLPVVSGNEAGMPDPNKQLTDYLGRFTKNVALEDADNVIYQVVISWQDKGNVGVTIKYGATGYTDRTYSVIGNSTLNNNAAAAQAITTAMASISRVGYTFGGWYVNGDTENIVSEERLGVLDILILPSVSSIEFAILWNPVKYDLVFYDGSVELESLKKATNYYDMTTVLPSLDNTESHLFIGWTRRGTATNYYAGENVNALTSEDGATITFDAVWKAKDVTITYNHTNGVFVLNEFSVNSLYIASGYDTEITVSGYFTAGYTQSINSLQVSGIALSLGGRTTTVPVNVNGSTFSFTLPVKFTTTGMQGLTELTAVLEITSEFELNTYEIVIKNFDNREEVLNGTTSGTKVTHGDMLNLATDRYENDETERPYHIDVIGYADATNNQIIPTQAVVTSDLVIYARIREIEYSVQFTFDTNLIESVTFSVNSSDPRDVYSGVAMDGFIYGNQLQFTLKLANSSNRSMPTLSVKYTQGVTKTVEYGWNNGTYTFTLEGGANLTLENLQLNKYTVSYSNKGSQISTQAITHGNAHVVARAPSDDVSPINNVFSGWRNGAALFAVGETIDSVENDYAFVAEWTPKDVTVTYSGDNKFTISGYALGSYTYVRGYGTSPELTFTLTNAYSYLYDSEDFNQISVVLSDGTNSSETLVLPIDKTGNNSFTVTLPLEWGNANAASSTLAATLTVDTEAWTINKYTVTLYDKNQNGDREYTLYTQVDVEHGSSLADVIAEYEKHGQGRKPYYQSAEYYATKDATSSLSYATISVMGDVAYYVSLSNIEYTLAFTVNSDFMQSVTVTLNGGQAAVYTSDFSISRLVYGDELVITPTFKEGTTTPQSTLTFTYNTDVVANKVMSAANSFTYSVEHGGDVTFTDIDIRRFSVSYDGGSSTNYKYGDTVTLNAIPTGTDYSRGFDGWKQSDTTDIYAAGSTITLTDEAAKNYTLIGQWSAKDVLMYYQENNGIYTLDGFTETYNNGTGDFKAKTFVDKYNKEVELTMKFNPAYTSNTSLTAISVTVGRTSYQATVSSASADSITFRLTIATWTSENIIAEQFVVNTALAKNTYTVSIYDKTLENKRTEYSNLEYGTTLAQIANRYESEPSSEVLRYYEHVKGYYVKVGDGFDKLSNDYALTGTIALYADIAMRDYDISISFSTQHISKVTLNLLDGDSPTEKATSTNGTLAFGSAHHGEVYSISIELAASYTHSTPRMLVTYIKDGASVPGGSVGYSADGVGKARYNLSSITYSVNLSFLGFTLDTYSLNYFMDASTPAYELGAIDSGTEITVLDVPARVSEFAAWADRGFDGWKLKDESGAFTGDFYMPRSKFNITKNMDLYAVWTDKDVNVTFGIPSGLTVSGTFEGGGEYTFANNTKVVVVDGNDKTVRFTVSTTAAYSQAFDALITAGSISYTYNGTPATAAITRTGEDALSATFSITFEFDTDPSRNDIDLALNITSPFEKNTYTLKVFDGNEGASSAAEYTVEVTHGQTYSDYTSVYLSSYKSYYKKLTGFYTRAEVDGSTVDTVADINQTFTGNVDLYAKWTYEKFGFKADIDINLITIKSITGANAATGGWETEYNTSVTVATDVNTQNANEAAPYMIVSYKFNSLPTHFDTSGLTATDDGYCLRVSAVEGEYTFNLLYDATITFDVTERETLVLSYEEGDYFTLDGFTGGKYSIPHGNNTGLDLVLTFKTPYTQNAAALNSQNVSVSLVRTVDGGDPVTVTGQYVATSNAEGKLTITLPLSFESIDGVSSISVSIGIDSTAFKMNTYKVKFLDGTQTNNELTELEMTVAHNSTYSLRQVPTVVGYTGLRVFSGWNDGTKTYAASELITSGITADTTYTAVWTEEKIKLTADSNAAFEFVDFTNGARLVDNNGNVTIQLALKDGYKISANTTLANISVTFNDVTASYPITAIDNVISFTLNVAVTGNNIDGDANSIAEKSIVVNTVFVIETFTITVKHESTSINTATVNYGASYILPNEPNVEGYNFVRIFKGWYIDEQRPCVAAGTEIANITSSFEIKAVWEEEDVTVSVTGHDAFTATVAKKGESALGNSVTVKNGDTVTIVLSFKDGYAFALATLNKIAISFNGASHEIDLSGGQIDVAAKTITFDFDVTIGSNVSLDGDAATVIVEAVTVTTPFHIQTFTVTINNADDTTIEIVSVNYGTEYKLPSMPNVVGYSGVKIFKGWYVSEEKQCEAVGSVVSPSVTENITIKAVWEEEDVTVTVTNSAAFAAGLSANTVKNGGDVTVTLTFADGYKHNVTSEVTQISYTFNGKSHTVSCTANVSLATLSFTFAATVTSGVNLDGNADTVISEAVTITNDFPIQTYSVKIVNANGAAPQETFAAVEYGSALSSVTDAFELAYSGYTHSYFSDATCHDSIATTVTLPTDSLTLTENVYTVYVKLTFEVKLYDGDSYLVKEWGEVVYGTTLSTLIDEYENAEVDFAANDYVYEDASHAAIDKTKVLDASFTFYVIKTLKQYSIVIECPDDTSLNATLTASYGATLKSVTDTYENGRQLKFAYYGTAEYGEPIDTSVIINPENIAFVGTTYAIYVKVEVEVTFNITTDGETNSETVTASYGATLSSVIASISTDLSAYDYAVYSTYAEGVENTPISDFAVTLTENQTYYIIATTSVAP